MFIICTKIAGLCTEEANSERGSLEELYLGAGGKASRPQNRLFNAWLSKNFWDLSGSLATSLILHPWKIFFNNYLDKAIIIDTSLDGFRSSPISRLAPRNEGDG
jgi:hypothetical protein